MLDQIRQAEIPRGYLNKMVDAFLASGQNYFDTAWTYMDGESDSVQSRKCLEVAEEFGKKVIVMELVKGGMLANVPEEASEILAQVEDNLSDFVPLSKAEDMALKKAARVILDKTAIPCTGCSYCVSGCPQRVWIPKYFKLYNEYAAKPDDKWKVQPEYKKMTEGRGAAKDCIGCGACESVCPQHLPIIEHLKKVSEALD